MLGRYIAITLVGLGGAMVLAPDAPERAPEVTRASAPVLQPDPGPVRPVVVADPVASGPETEADRVQASAPATRVPQRPAVADASAPRPVDPAQQDGQVALGGTDPLAEPGSSALALSLLGTLQDDVALPTLESPDSLQDVAVGSDTLALISLVEQDVAPEGQGATGAEAGEATPEASLLYVTGSRVNVRSGPSTGYSVISSVAFGDAVEVLEETADGWAEIRIADGSTGFMARRFLEE